MADAVVVLDVAVLVPVDASVLLLVGGGPGGGPGGGAQAALVDEVAPTVLLALDDELSDVLFDALLAELDCRSVRSVFRSWISVALAAVVLAVAVLLSALAAVAVAVPVEEELPVRSDSRAWRSFTKVALVLLVVLLSDDWAGGGPGGGGGGPSVAEACVDESVLSLSLLSLRPSKDANRSADAELVMEPVTAVEDPVPEVEVVGVATAVAVAVADEVRLASAASAAAALDDELPLICNVTPPYG